MKKYLLTKILTLLFLLFLGTNTLLSQTFCCCNDVSGSACAPEPTGLGCDFLCDLLFVSNNGTDAGYTEGCPGTSCEIVPVEITFFKGKVIQDNQVQLTWETALEFDNEGFEIQRANADFTWEFLDFERGNGNTTETINYSFIDRNPYPGTNYYRFKQIDYDGNFEFSKVIAVTIKNIKGDVVTFPTLAKDRLLIKYAETPAELPIYRISDMMGRRIIETTSEQGILDITDLESGQYVLSFLLNNTLHTETFFKIN